MKLRLGRDLLIYWPVLLLALLTWMQPLPAIAVPPSPITYEWNDTNNRDRYLNCISRAIYLESSRPIPRRADSRGPSHSEQGQ